MKVSLAHVADSPDALFHHFWIFWEDLALKGREVDLMLLEEQPAEKITDSFVEVVLATVPKNCCSGVVFCCQKEIWTNDHVQDQAANRPVVSYDACLLKDTEEAVRVCVVWSIASSYVFILRIYFDNLVDISEHHLLQRFFKVNFMSIDIPDYKFSELQLYHCSQNSFQHQMSIIFNHLSVFDQLRQLKWE